MHSKKPLTILNVGNTHVHLFDLMEDGALASRAILTTAEFAASPVKWLEKSRQFAASSVVPAVTRMLSSLGVFVVSPEMTFPFSVRKLDLSTVGADRLANAARLTEGKLPAVCIDFGTAVTFEIVTDAGEFTGGAIMPGRMLLRHALHDYTAQLPLLALADSIPELPGSSTCDAMRIGTDLAAVGAVREILASLEKQFPTGSLRKVACGGDRRFFLQYLELEDGGDDFTPQGVRRIWECNC